MSTFNVRIYGSVMSDNENRPLGSRPFEDDCRSPRENRRFSGERAPHWITSVLMLLSVMVGCGPSAAPSVETASLETAGRFRISGPSMNPTLWDVSYLMRCPSCGISIRTDATLWKASLSTSPLKCWHCGNGLDQATADVVQLPPDEIQVLETGAKEFQAGELVLLRHSEDNVAQSQEDRHLHVKRILATPGQTVSVGTEGRLLVDNQIPQFVTTPRVLVDSGKHRQKTRWHPISDGWWRYHHELVYRGHRPGPILDDYPGNLGIDRRLYPADRLCVKVSAVKEDLRNSSAVDDSQELEDIQFWNEQPDDILGLSNERPIAVRLHAQHNRGNTGEVIRLLNVYREIVFRVDTPRREESIGVYPMKLVEDEFFVVGDNVPLSVDSRSWGPIRRKDLLGRVTEKAESPTTADDAR